MSVSRLRSVAVASLVVVATMLAGACASTPLETGGVTIVIEGHESVTETRLIDSAARELEAFGANERRPADAADAAYAMERHLRWLGHSRADVSFALRPSEDAPESLVFHVREGPKTIISSVRFPGSKAIAESLLRAMLQESFPLPFSGGRPYRRADVDEAITKIESMYLLDGYVRVRVGPVEAAFNEDKSQVELTIPVIEGPRYTVSRIRVDPTLPQELRRALRPLLRRRGAPFHVRVGSVAAAAVRGFLHERGHQTAVVRASHTFDEDAPTVSVQLSIEPGPVTTLGHYEITGLERTNVDFAYERITTLHSGELLRQSDLGNAVDALYGTGVFRSVRVSAIPRAPAGDDLDTNENDATDAAPLVADLTLNVEEADARSFEVGGGWGSYEQARGWVAYRDRNFTNRARLLEITGFGSLKGEGLDTRVTDRYLLGRNRTLTVSVRAERREEPSFDTDSLELEASIRQPLGPGNSIIYGYRMRFDDTSDNKARIRGVDEGKSRAAGLFSSVRHDTRDDRLFPTRGVNAEFGVFWSDNDIGADLDFLEWKANWARYFEIAHETIFAVGFRFTTRDVLNNDLSLPIQERLFLGGENSVRAYQQDELGPTDRGNDPIGGLTAAMASIELRRRIWRDVDGALFYEVGTVSPDAFDLQAPAGIAIGTGLRYRLPIGPIRLDFAYNPSHRFAASRRWQIHLSFGFSF